MRIPLAIAAALLAAGCAGQPSRDDAAAKSATEPTQTSAAETPPNCMQDTGSRIRRSEDRPCVAAPGSVYTREDIERSGATTTSEALRRLSPSIR